MELAISIVGLLIAGASFWLSCAADRRSKAAQLAASNAAQKADKYMAVALQIEKSMADVMGSKEDLEVPAFNIHLEPIGGGAPIPFELFPTSNAPPGQELDLDFATGMAASPHFRGKVFWKDERGEPCEETFEIKLT